MTRKKTKAITIDKLAKMVQRGFVDQKEYMDKRFGEIDERFEQVDKRFEKIDERFEQVDKRFQKVESTISVIVDRLDGIDADLSDIKRNTKSLMVLDDKQDREISLLNIRVGRLEKKVAAGV